MNATHHFGALIDLEAKVVEWIGRLMGLDDPILREFSTHKTGSAVLDALDRGEVDVTFSHMFQGGFHGNESRRQEYLSSCSTSGHDMFVTVTNSSGIRSNTDLLSFLEKHPEAKVGAVSDQTLTFMKFLVRPHNVTERWVDTF